MSFTPNIVAFCCHYTSQQTLAEGQETMEHEGFPSSITIKRKVCTGKLKVSELLQAFEEGADGVYVVGCPADKCHNLLGSQRAAKRVGAVKKALEELEIGGDRIEMFHMERGFHPEFIAAAQQMDARIRKLGPSPISRDE